jgi:hypothetical protein
MSDCREKPVPWLKTGDILQRGWWRADVVDEPPAILDERFHVWLRPWPWWKYLVMPVRWRLVRLHIKLLGKDRFVWW